ncbi:HPP family protein [Pigmentiphaga soli]|uniref:HPP family protein n=1 Tax=Pigmentiphaga soli TaxID=1007095 RepID=A0ABP8GY15_9BURK
MISRISRFGGMAFLRAFRPTAQHISAREKGRAALGAAIGILAAALGSAWLLRGGPAHGHAMLAAALVAPMGASAVLVFAVPSSPLAQPWSVIGGNTLSALAGIACAAWVPDVSVAAGLAAGLAVAIMLAARCLHPPGGASALLMVLTGADHFSYAFNPVLLDSVLLVAAGLAYNNLTRHPWPHRHRPAAPEPGAARLTSGDLDAALAHYNQVLDISRDDLQELLQHAEAAAYRRTMGELRCADVMSRNPITAGVEMSLRHAWGLMRKHRVKALPVIDLQRHLVGIVTVADFMKQVDLDVHEGMAYRLRSLVRQFRGKADTPHTVGQIMTRQVRVSSSDRLLIDLVPVFSDGGHRHIPILDGERRLAGIITQSDLIKALYSAVRG